MSALRLSADSSGEEILLFAKMVHELASLPVTMRSKNKKGVRLEKGNVVVRELPADSAAGGRKERILLSKRLNHLTL